MQITYEDLDDKKDQFNSNNSIQIIVSYFIFLND